MPPANLISYKNSATYEFYEYSDIVPTGVKCVTFQINVAIRL